MLPDALQPWLEKRPETRLIVLERLMRGRHDRADFQFRAGPPASGPIAFLGDATASLTKITGGTAEREFNWFFKTMSRWHSIGGTARRSSARNHGRWKNSKTACRRRRTIESHGASREVRLAACWRAAMACAESVGAARRPLSRYCTVTSGWWLPAAGRLARCRRNSADQRLLSCLVGRLRIAAVRSGGAVSAWLRSQANLANASSNGRHAGR